MKTLCKFYCISVILLFLFSCGSPDSVKDAKKENAEKIDSQKNTVTNIDSANLPSRADANFLVNAASGAMMEVQLGELAKTNARNQRVKGFGSMMIKDHGEGIEKVKALASSKNITLPDSISRGQQKDIDNLKKKKGTAFDQAYINLMIDDHKKDIKEFDEEATSGTNEAIKSLASDNLKMLHTHLDSATNIQKLVGKPPTSTSGPVYPPY
jgi:putative membrane protein